MCCCHVLCLTRSSSPATYTFRHVTQTICADICRTVQLCECGESDLGLICCSLFLFSMCSCKCYILTIYDTKNPTVYRSKNGDFTPKTQRSSNAFGLTRVKRFLFRSTNKRPSSLVTDLFSQCELTKFSSIFYYLHFHLPHPKQTTNCA